MGQLAGRVVLIRPLAVQRGHGSAMAEIVIGVIEARVDRAVGSVIDQMQKVASEVVVVGRIGVVAHVLAIQSAESVIGIGNKGIFVAVLQASQSPDLVYVI